MHFTYEIRACNDKKVFFRAVIVVVESLFFLGTSGISNLRQDRSIDSRSKISYVGICQEFFIYW